VSILVLSFFLAWEVPRLSPITYRQTDLLPIYLGLHALVTGHDPYSLAVGAEAYRQTVGYSFGLTIDRAAQFGFHYPLAPALLYLPFSLFASLENATLLVRALTVALYLTALCCLIRRYAAASAPLAKGGMLFWGIGWWPFPVIILPMVQPSGVVFAALAFCLLAVRSGRWFWGGFACFVALLKPQDALPVLAVLAIYALLRAEARWRLLAGFAAAAALPVTAAFLWRPDWLGAWLEAVIALPPHIPGFYQNPPAALAAALGPVGVVVWIGVGVLVVGWLALVAWGSRTRDPQWGIAMSCALMVALGPRTGIWEMVIGLIPWFYTWEQAGGIRQQRTRHIAQAALWLLWLAAGFLTYAGYGLISGVGFGLGLVVALAVCAAEAGPAPLARPEMVQEETQLPGKHPVHSLEV
jgi:hypothetical protein